MRVISLLPNNNQPRVREDRTLGGTTMKTGVIIPLRAGTRRVAERAARRAVSMALRFSRRAFFVQAPQ